MTTTTSDAPAPPARDASARRRPRVGVVLGSGGLKCVAAVGLWKVLQREGIEIDLHVGCSGGAVYAAVMALGMDADEGEAVTPGLWGRALSARLRYRSMLRLMVPRLFRVNERFGLLDDRPLLAALYDVYQDRTFEETVRPLVLVATDLHSGERVLIDRGRVIDGVRASLALPLVFRPWPFEGRLMTDGGATDPLPISVAIRERCDLIIAMGFESPLHERMDSIRVLASQTSSIAMNALMRSTFAFYNAVHHAEIVPVLPEFGGRVNLRDTTIIPRLMAAGERAAERELPAIRGCLASLQARLDAEVATPVAAGGR